MIISAWNIIIFCFTILADIAIIWWWWRLLRIGLKRVSNLSDRDLRKAIRKLFLFFTGIQIMVAIISFFAVFVWWVRTPIAMLEVKELVASSSPDYFKAALLCESISKDQKIPPVYRYRSKIRAVAYKLSTVFVDKEDLINVRRNILKEIDNEHYFQAEKMLANVIDRAIKNKENGRKPSYFYVDLRDELKEAQGYCNLPKFSDVPPDYFGLFYDIGSAPIPILFPPIT
ncbi:MAG: hypothetical protein WC315_06480 [Candidatus Omnitrophota bacterium]